MELINCEPFSARLTPRSCEANLTMALTAATVIRDTGSATSLSHQQLERLAGCGHCPRVEATFRGATEELKAAIFRDLDKLTDEFLGSEMTQNRIGNDQDKWRARWRKEYWQKKAKREAAMREEESLDEIGEMVSRSVLG